MHFEIAPLFCRPWTLNGMSPKLIESHYERNYRADVGRLNAVTEELEAIGPEVTARGTISRLKREQIDLLNATLLHELYFASLGGDGRALPEGIATAIARDFGSVDRWRQEFITLAEALAGDSGWILLSYLPRDGRLTNQSAADHSQGIAGGIPILALVIRIDARQQYPELGRDARSRLRLQDAVAQHPLQREFVLDLTDRGRRH